MIDIISGLGKNDSLYQDLFKMLPKRDSLLRYVEEKRHCVCCCHPITLEDTIAWLKENVDPEIWFQDNLGEALVNVRIERSVWNTSLPLYKKVLVWSYRHVNHLREFPLRWLFVVLAIVAWFGIDAIVSGALKRKRKPKSQRKSKRESRHNATEESEP